MAVVRRRGLTEIGSAALKHAAMAADRVRRPINGVTVLIYHRVGGCSGTLVDLDVDVFATQMAQLAASNRLLSLDAAVAELAGTQARPNGDQRPAVVVTFDDGTADFVEKALPVLVANRVPVALYVATRFVDQGLVWPDGCPAASWSALADALATGLVTIGSHTHAHTLLDRAAPAEVAIDLDRSISLLEDRLGVGAQHFAYPKAVVPAPLCEQEVRARFTSAALAGNRPNAVGCDLHRLWRTPIQTTDTGPFFTAKAAGGMRLEATARDVANRLRYRGATH